ncbi:DUF4097 family beta strand repeat-containing protein [Pseudoalteromonas fenneropenaei]|uniref:DUF4097 family beta strand repeat-containing protein n=1 Tax=Pseudoalteromonas fenneropenaei TaxID=1737459 RepID=A0ABV7CJE9_9GAMM
MYKLLSAAVMTAILSGCVIHIDGKSGKRADVRETEQLQLDATGLRGLVADTDAGDISIEGVEGLDKVEILAKIQTTDARGYLITLERDGDKAQLIAKARGKEPAGFAWYSGNSPRIDLVVRVPQGFTLDLDDDSGDIAISGLQGDITIEDDSGDIVLSGGAKVTIHDDSGDILVSNATGDVSIEDGSGDMLVKNIKGSVYINDGSGDIHIDGANGLTIADAGSGDLSIHNVKGNVKVAD